MNESMTDEPHSEALCFSHDTDLSFCGTVNAAPPSPALD